MQKAYKQIDNYYINQIFSERMKKDLCCYWPAY